MKPTIAAVLAVFSLAGVLVIAAALAYALAFLVVAVL